MNLFIYNDGRVAVTESGKPINIPMDNLLVCCTNPQEGEVMTFDGKMWVNKAYEADPRLYSLGIEDVTLTPAFAPDTFSYTGTHTGAGELDITSIPSASIITIKDKSTDIDAEIEGNTLTISNADGEVTLEISIDSGSKTTKYTVTITNTAGE